MWPSGAVIFGDSSVPMNPPVGVGQDGRVVGR